MNKITDDILYIGTDDLNIDLFESQYDVPEGMSYNSFLILDEKIAVMDTTDRQTDEKWKDNSPQTKGEPFDFQIISYPEDQDDKQNTKAKTELEKRIRKLYEQGRKKDPEVFKDDIKLDKHKIYTVVQYSLK